MFGRVIIGISLLFVCVISALPAQGGLEANLERTMTALATDAVVEVPELLARPLEAGSEGSAGRSLGATPAHESFRLGRRLGESEASGGAAKKSEPGVVDTRAAFAFFIVLVLIVALWAGLRRFAGSAGGLLGQLGPGGRAPSGLLTVLGRYPVARGQTLVLLKLDSRVLLLSQSAQGFRTLSDINDAEEVASILTKARDEDGDSMASRFKSLLSKAERDPSIVTADETYVEAGPRAPWHESELEGEMTENNDPVSSIRRRLRSLGSPNE